MNQNFLHNLFLNINKSHLNTTEDEISLFILEHRKEIPTTSLNKLIKNSYFSQSSISKYLKKNGLTYSDLQTICLKNSITEKQTLNVYLGDEYSSPDDLRNLIVTMQLANVEMLNVLDMNVLDDFIDKIFQSKNIYIFGGSMSLTNLASVQNILNSIGYNCYTIYDFEGQTNICKYITSEDIVVMVSLRGLVLEANQKLMNKIYGLQCPKILLTCETSNDYERYGFDEVIKIGSRINPFFSMQLNCFSILLGNLIVRKYNLL